MNAKPQTIQIFLPFGSARDMKIASITTRNIEAIYIPRSKLNQSSQRDEVNSVGIYFLLGESEESAKPLVYIGETENCYSRLKQHDQKKDFWNAAIIIRSKTNDFNRAHVRYLEYFCHNKIKQIDRYQVENSQIPVQPHIQETTEAELMDHIETITILLSALGSPVLEETHKADSGSDAAEMLYCTSKNANACGRYLEDGFIVYKGSRIIKDTVPSGERAKEARDKLFNTGILENRDDGLYFARDQIFNSPSYASNVILGRSSNGWIEWKNSEGKTLDELKRQNQNTDLVTG
ncbi:MAG: GIY-YIG nuclease family protein [Cyanobacteria bacterium]|nr:GIY-YIG nuclease family protein [Cyanobacteriota bacterium]